MEARMLGCYYEEKLSPLVSEYDGGSIQATGRNRLRLARAVFPELHKVCCRRLCLKHIFSSYDFGDKRREYKSLTPKGQIGEEVVKQARILRQFSVTSNVSTYGIPPSPPNLVRGKIPRIIGGRKVELRPHPYSRPHHTRKEG